MIAAAPILTQLFLNCAALAGLIMLHWVLARRGAYDPINRRFLFVLRVTMLLFLGRVLIIVTGISAFRSFVLLGAALIPLAVLLLTEGLLRRHAPSVTKAFVSVGAVIFGVSALWYSDSIDPPRLIGLLVFQLTGFLMAGWLVLRRDTASLSAAENLTVVRLGWSLALFIPLSFSDFLLLYLGLPIQFSGLGVLIMCWLAVGLGRAYQGHRATLLQMGIMLAAAAFVGGIITVFTGIGRDGFLMTTAVLIAMIFLVALLDDTQSLRREEQSISLLRHLATAPLDNPPGFLRGLQAHAVVEGAVMIGADDLKDLQETVLQDIFAASPVLRKAGQPPLDPVAEDHVRYLFDRFAATHLMLVSEKPMSLLALNIPGLSASPAAEMELLVAQRMAILLANQKEDAHG